MTNTAADRWCNIYTFVTMKERKRAEPDPVTGKKPERPFHGFINLSGLIKRPEWLKEPEKYIINPKAKARIVTIDGFPHQQVKHKFIDAIRMKKDDYKGIVYMLSVVFRPECIEFLWPDITLRARNMDARKQQRREFCEYRAALKKIPKADRQLHAEVERITQNRSASAIVRERRNFSR